MNQNRPTGRQKNTAQGKGSVQRRGDGLNLGGPRGASDGYSSRGNTNSREQQRQNMGSQPPPRAGWPVGGGRAPQIRFRTILVLIVVLVLLYFFLTRCSGLSLEDLANSFLAGGTGTSYSQASLGSGYANSEIPNRNGVLDTTVSELARAKRTQILGNGQDTVTIMVYMCATDLESRAGLATADLQEMMNATIGESINIIVETGGAQQWKNNTVSSKTNQRYQVTSQGLRLLQDNLSKKSMVDPATLSDFIRYSTANFPANRYALIFWDHGGGSLSGFGYDMNFPGGSMTLDKIITALDGGGCTFDWIGFDACLMATLETALAIEPYADYMIASEETEPGGGWHYTNWISALSQNSSMPTIELGKRIVDDFIDYTGTGQGLTTQSVIDLAEVAGVVPDALRSFSQSTSAMIQAGDYQAVSNARSNAREFSSASGIDQVDLIQLAYEIGTEEGRAFSAALQGCVKYNRTCDSITNAYGISVYFPRNRTASLNSALNTYDKIGMDESYGECIRTFANLQLGGQVAGGGASLETLFGTLLGSGNAAAPPNSEDMIGILLNTFLQNGDYSILDGFTAGETPDWIDKNLLLDSAGYLAENQFDASQLSFSNKYGTQVLHLEESQWALVQALELNVFVDDGAGFIDLGLDNVFDFDSDGDLIAEYDNTWLSINGQVVSYYMTAQHYTGDSYLIQGRVPALLNGELVDIMLEFTDENPDGAVVGAQLCYEGETDTQAKGLLPIADGDTIDFLCDYYAYDRSFINNYYLGEQMVVNGPLVVRNIDIGDADVIACYRFTDIYNNAFWTPEL